MARKQTDARRWDALRRRSETAARAYERRASQVWNDDAYRDPEARAYAYLQYASEIRNRAAATRVGRSPSSIDLMAARHNAEELERMVGRVGSGRSTAAQREDLFFREQIRAERRGELSGLFGGDFEAAQAEGIFYAATQDIWSGRYADRDAAIMEAIGVDTLEEAYTVVLRQNEEALRAALTGGNIAGSTRPGSDVWMMYIRYVS